MAAYLPAPSLANIRSKFDDVRKAGKNFIPDSAEFVLNSGKRAETLGKNAWMLVARDYGTELHQNPGYWLRRKWSRREADAALTEILKAYRASNI